MRWVSETKEWLRGVVFRGRAEAESDEEMRFHIEMEAAHRERTGGVDADEARRQAALAFGGVDKHREQVREARGLGWLSGLSLDVKLGARMLKKYPGLTIAGGLALALAVALAASWFEFLTEMTSPRLPMPDGNRIVAIQNWDRTTGAPKPRSLPDYEFWRDESRTLEDVAAAATGDFGVTAAGERYATVAGARVSASMLRLPRVAPLLGRALTEDDARGGDLLPVVIGYRLWQELFDGDRGVVGQPVRVGESAGTVVGVMPEGFGFPINQELWLPLRETALAGRAGTGPNLTLLARLRVGASLAEAEAEVEVLEERLAAAYPQTHANVQTSVRRFTEAVSMSGFIHVINIPFILFLVVVCANVATLVFARTATRTGEIAVRSALGASRRRLVLQLAAEALVLTGAAALLGLALASWGLDRGMALFWEVQQERPPFWFDSGLSTTTYMYAAVLAVAAAAVIGGLPALKATRSSLRPQLIGAGTGGAALRFGRVSTGVIITQVALCVAFLPVAITMGRDLAPEGSASGGFAASDYLSAQIILDDAVAGRDSVDGARTDDILGEVKVRLAAQPGVERVSLVSRMPGFNHPVESYQISTDTAEAHSGRVVGVDADAFDMLGGRIAVGRDFAPAEYRGGVPVLIADASWAEEAMPGRSPIGQRVRFPERDGEGARWHEIVGVVSGMEKAVGPGENIDFYEPLRLAGMTGAHAYVRTSVPPASLVRDMSTAVIDVDPALTLGRLAPLEDVWRPVLRGNLFFTMAVNAVALIILVFALAGIYAMMSFTVAQRAREIAIRAALGADPRRIIRAIFTRAFVQIGAGVLVGVIIVGAAATRSTGDALLLASVASLMLVVGLAGCILPVRRALRIQPTEALRME